MISDGGYDYEPRICIGCNKDKCTEMPSECESDAMEAQADRASHLRRED